MNTYVDHEGDNVDIPEDEECWGEQIDGIWETNGCGCEDCRQVEDDAIEHAAESGRITDVQARAMHLANDAARGIEGA